MISWKKDLDAEGSSGVSKILASLSQSAALRMSPSRTQPRQLE